MFFLMGTALAEETVEIKDQGVFGTLFEIAEEDMLALIQTTLTRAQEDGSLKKLETKIQTDLTEKAIHPKGSPSLKKCTSSREFFVDPSLTLEEDIKDHEGHFLGKKGMRLNPLEHHSLSKGLLFIDGEDDSQLAYAVQNKEAFHVVLTNGSPVLRGEEHQMKLYFDQNGIITKKYGITQIPATLQQEGTKLKITEFCLEEES